MDLESLGEELPGVVVGERGHHHAVAALLPVGRGGHLLLSRQLEGVDDAEDLGEVPPGGGRVQDGQLERLVRSDDEDRAAGQRDALLVLLHRVQHPVQLGHLAVRVGHDRVAEVHQLVVRLDVLDPASGKSNHITEN